MKAGADWIKVMATGGNMTRHTNTFEVQYNVDELAGCVAEAHRLRVRVTAHAHGAAGIRVAVEAGVDMIEHCTFSIPRGIEFDEETADLMATKGVIVSPTVSVGYRNWTDDGRKQQRANVIRGLLARGCPVIMSTDCGIPGVPHAALADGLQVMQELSGLSAVETLKLATSTSASILGLADRGVLAPGKRADILVADGDPTADLAALGQVRYVLKAGEVLYRGPGR